MCKVSVQNKRARGEEVSMGVGGAVVQLPSAAALLPVGGSTKAEGEGGVFGGYISV